MKDDEMMTAQPTGLSPIGRTADVGKQWPDNICSGKIRYSKAGNYDGFALSDITHGIPTFGSVCDTSPPTVRGQHVRVFNYPKQTEAIAKQLVTRWNFHEALVNALSEMIAAIDASAIDSEMLPGEPEVGINPHKWHDEWAHHVRAILASLHREAIAEKPCFEGVTPESPERSG